jgi:hypothetical protein
MGTSKAERGDFLDAIFLDRNETRTWETNLQILDFSISSTNLPPGRRGARGSPVRSRGVAPLCAPAARACPAEMLVKDA